MDTQSQDQSMDSVPSTGNQSNMMPAMIIVAVLALLGAGVYGYQAMQSSDASSAPGGVTESVEALPAEDAMAEASYSDGEYAAVGQYTSPAGPEEIGVELTLTDGVIIDAEVEVKATHAISKVKQEDFAANYKAHVIGKPINEVKLSKVSGSSLTPQGFNDALEKIKSEAQS